MKHRPFIHITLIALMLFSQVISSVHVAGHLNAPDILVAGEYSLDDAASSANGAQAAAAAFVDTGHVHHHQHHAGHADHADHAKHAEHAEHAEAIGGIDADCLIYHAYTNLNGFVPVDTLHSSIQTLISGGFPSHTRHVSLLALDTQRIRGPPLLS